jgi:hypothetical protein
LELPGTGRVAFHRLTLDPAALLCVVGVQADASGRVTASFVRLPSPMRPGRVTISLPADLSFA